MPIAPGDASIIEVKWKYPGTYFFHSHCIQEEHVNIGLINEVGISGTYGDKNIDENGSMQGIYNVNINNALTNTSNNGSVLTENISMFDW